jgi:hypothetical protein
MFAVVLMCALDHVPYTPQVPATSCIGTGVHNLPKFRGS